MGITYREINSYVSAGSKQLFFFIHLDSWRFDAHFVYEADRGVVSYAVTLSRTGQKRCPLLPARATRSCNCLHLGCAYMRPLFGNCIHILRFTRDAIGSGFSKDETSSPSQMSEFRGNVHFIEATYLKLIPCSARTCVWYTSCFAREPII